MPSASLENINSQTIPIQMCGRLSGSNILNTCSFDFPVLSIIISSAMFLKIQSNPFKRIGLLNSKDAFPDIWLSVSSLWTSFLFPSTMEWIQIRRRVFCFSSESGYLSCSFDQGLCGWIKDKDGDLHWETTADPAGGGRTSGLYSWLWGLKPH